MVLVTTRPVKAAPTTEEVLVDTDRTLAQVRKMTVEYGERQGTIDTQTLQELKDDHITVIPCPGHKDDPKGWVHKTAPLLRATSGDGLKAVS